MKYQDFEKILSSARLKRYLNACQGDENRALQLYRLNIRLSQEFYAILSMFEIALRNAINEHYISHFNDTEWLKNQCLGNGFLNNQKFSPGRFKSKRRVDSAIRELGIKYTHDRLVATLSFGFWVNLFAPLQFRLAGQNLHRIFPNRPKGTNPKQVFIKLNQVLDFRNRIAHHEPICFNSSSIIDITNAQNCYDLIIRLVEWMALDKIKFFKDIDNTLKVISEIKTLNQV